MASKYPASVSEIFVLRSAKSSTENMGLYRATETVKPKSMKEIYDVVRTSWLRGIPTGVTVVADLSVGGG